MMSTCIVSNKLRRKYMEDHYYVNLNKKFFCISDGHGGDFSSRYLCKNFLTELEKTVSTLDYEKNNVVNIFTFFDLCKNLDLQLYKDIKNQNINDVSGTTFSSVFVLNNYLYFLNVGDSITGLISNNKLIYINEIHKPENEKKRIEKYFKVINNRINGNINISRTFGDFKYKNLNDYYNSPIIAKPNLYFINLNELKNKNSWIILASDGIYEKYSIEVIIDSIDLLLEVGFHKKLISFLILKHYKFIKSEDNLTFIIVLINKIKEDIDKKNNFNLFIDFHKNNILNEIKIYNNNENKIIYFFLYYVKNLNLKKHLEFILYILKDYILYDYLW